MMWNKNVSYLFPRFIPFPAFYPLFRVLSLFPRFILFSAFCPFSRVLSFFPRFIPFSAFYPFFRVLSLFPRFIPFSAFYPFFRVLSPFPRFIPFSASAIPYFRNSGSVFYPNPFISSFTETSQFREKHLSDPLTLNSGFHSDCNYRDFSASFGTVHDR